MKSFLPVLVIALGSRVEAEGERDLIYLMKYGYMESKEGTAALQTEEGLRRKIKKAVMDFQAFAGLNQTGVVDGKTREMMETPRCGVRDIIGHGAYARRRKRYVLQGSRWRVTDLTYRVTKYPTTTRLKKSQIDRTMKQAFGMWEAATDLTFSLKSSGSVHIEIRFERYEHGDGDAFDGPGGTLAHAYFPQYGGDVHVDDTEFWTIDSFKGTNILQTMVHEIGHSLGLSHSDVRAAIMAPFYKGWDPNMKLDKDDIKGIQALYGEKQEKQTSPRPQEPASTSSPSPGFDFPDNEETTPSNGDEASLCSDTHLDTIFRTESGDSYVFQGEQYWRLTKESVAKGFPKRISEDWSGLPNHLDAAFTWQDTGATYIFKGEEYWKFTNMDPEPGYPKLISEGFPGIPSSIDTAFVWGGNNKIYFFKQNQYWKFDPQRKPHVRSDVYPKDIRDEWGLPGDMEGALQWDNGKTYFFKGESYWRFNDRRFAVDRGTPAFPRNAGEWWFGCPRVQSLLQGERGEEELSLDLNPNSQAGGEDVIGDNEVGNEVLDVYTYDE